MNSRKISAVIGATALGVVGALVVPAVDPAVANATPLCFPTLNILGVVQGHCDFVAPSNTHVVCDVGGYGNIIWEHCWGPEGGFTECATGKVPDIVYVRNCPEREEWF